MIKLVIFDLDGTLLNTLPTIAYYGNKALSEYGLPAIETERYKTLVGNGRDLLIHRMLAETGNDTPELYQKVGKVYDAAYEADQLYLTEPYGGIEELLRSLKEKGVRLAVLSNKPDNVVKPIVDKMFGGLFDEVWGKRSDYPVKPAPDGAFEICRIVGVSADETAFVGDTYVDIETGKNADLLTIGVEWGFRTREELKKAGADFIVEHPLEIENKLN
ncbi:MAG: HAD family hydrolase [Eubacteriales bacterium]|nr:HAD family hydrolase [Eubacteriales bacterium]